MIKLLVIGNKNVGKTNMVQRFVNDKFSDDYSPTIVSDFALKVFNIDGVDLRI